jgi:hypothetical protein
MFKQFIDKIPGADFFMVSSFLFFFLFFVLVGLYLVFANKKHIQYMAELPLNESNNKQENSHEKAL